MEQLKDYGYYKKDALAMVNDFWDLIEKNLQEGNTIMFQGYGNFAPHLRKARSCPNPITREMMDVPARYTVKFTAGRLLKLATRKWDAAQGGEEEVSFDADEEDQEEI